MGIEKTVSAEGFFGKIQQVLREGLGRETAGGANLGTVTLEVKDATMARAESSLGRAEEMNKNFGLRPGGGLAGGWDRPEDYSGKDPGAMAASRWASLQQGGAIHTMRNVGSFYQRWGSSLSEQDRGEAGMWSAMTASPGGRKVEDAVSGIERGGKRMAELLAEYEQAGRGTPAALKATEQMIRLKESIEALAASGKDGAEAIGGEHGKSMKAEIEKVTQLAVAGQAGGSGGGLTGNAGDFMRMAHGDPLGAMQGIFGGKILGALNKALMADSLGGASSALGGGAAGVAGIGAMGLGALYGGFKFGWGLQSSSAEAAMHDGGKALDDYRLSNSLGSGFDLRGLTYTNDRMHMDPNGMASLMEFNMPAVRRMLGGMGLGAGGWGGGGMGMMSTANTLFSSAMRFGVDDGALAGFVGNSVRSGETGRGESSVERLLGRIGGLIAEGNKHGIASSEKLGVLVSMRQMQQAATGFVTEGGSHYMENVSRVLDASGLDALKGQGGQSFMAKLGGNTNQVFNSQLALRFLDGNGRLTGAARAKLKGYFKSDEAVSAAIARFGDQFLAIKLAEDPANRIEQATQMLQGDIPGFTGNGFVTESLLLGGHATLKDVAASMALGSGEDPKALGQAHGDAGISAAAQKEATEYQSVVALSLMTDEVRNSTMALKDLAEFINVQIRLGNWKTDVSASTWDVVKHPVRSSLVAATSNRGGRDVSKQIITNKD